MFLDKLYLFVFMIVSRQSFEDFLYYNLIKYIIPEIGLSDISYYTRRRKANNTVLLVRWLHFIIEK